MAFLIPSGLPSWILDLDRTNWALGHWRFVSVSFFCLYFIVFGYVLLRTNSEDFSSLSSEQPSYFVVKCLARC